MDASFGRFALSAYVSPRLGTNRWALPDDVDFTKAVYAARGYVLLGGFDLNAMYFRDQGRRKNLFGLSASGFVGDIVELHVEALGRSGDSDVPPVPQVPGCGEPLEPGLRHLALTALGGSRLHFSDESIATVEYLYDSNALAGAGFERFREALPCVRAAIAATGAPVAADADPVGYPVDTAFLVRAHHIFVTYLRPHLTPDLFEDVSIFGGVALAPEDPSAILQAEVAYHFGGRALVGARAAYWLGAAASEAGLWPGRFVFTLELRVSY